CDVLLKLADHQTADKNWIQARLSYGRASTADPNRIEVWEHCAEMLMMQANWSDAAEFQLKALDLNPEDPSYWLRQAILLARAGKNQQFEELIGRMWKKFKTGTPAAVGQVALAAAAGSPPPAELPEIMTELQKTLSKLPGQGWPRYA